MGSKLGLSMRNQELNRLLRDKTISKKATTVSWVTFLDWCVQLVTSYQRTAANY